LSRPFAFFDRKNFATPYAFEFIDNKIEPLYNSNRFAQTDLRSTPIEFGVGQQRFCEKEYLRQCGNKA
jgi:hypothetical protein